MITNLWEFVSPHSLVFLFSTAICDNECIHGYCDGPLICACDSGWTGELCETG